MLIISDCTWISAHKTFSLPPLRTVHMRTTHKTLLLQPLRTVHMTSSNIPTYHFRFKVEQKLLKGLRSSMVSCSLVQHYYSVLPAYRSAIAAPEPYGKGESAEKSSLVTRPEAEIWSLGCLFSEAATWLVFGHDGLLTYRQNLLAANKGIPSFHDGEGVLVAINAQHKQLLQSIRDEDYITKNVVDHIIKRMLEVSATRLDGSEAWTLCMDTLYETPRIPPNDPLAFFAWKGDLNEINRRIEGGFDPNSTDDAGWTPLAYAAVYKRKDVVETLLKHGAIPSLQTRTGRTTEELVRKRLKGANSNASQMFNEILALLEKPQPFKVVRNEMHISSSPMLETWCLETSAEKNLCEKSLVAYRSYTGPTATPGITTIWDIIYNKTPETDILETFKTTEWHWLHLPANNVCLIAHIYKKKAWLTSLETLGSGRDSEYPR
jgi:hypothetical protein